MRVRILAAVSVIAVGLTIAGLAAAHKFHNDGPHPYHQPPVTASPQMVNYLRQAQPLPRTTSYINSGKAEINLGPLVQRLNESWSAYFGAAPGKPVVAVKGWGSAGVGMLDKGDAVYPMCRPDVKFDPTGSVIIYCQEPFLGSGANPHSGNILVPYQPFTAAVQKAQGNIEQAQLDVSLVAAFFYVSHIQYGLSSQGLASWQEDTAAQMCLAGVGTATLIPVAPTARQWLMALGFLHQFWHGRSDPAQATYLSQGYQTADPKKCFAGV